MRTGGARLSRRCCARRAEMGARERGEGEWRRTWGERRRRTASEREKGSSFLFLSLALCLCPAPLPRPHVRPPLSPTPPPPRYCAWRRVLGVGGKARSGAAHLRPPPQHGRQHWPQRRRPRCVAGLAAVFPRPASCGVTLGPVSAPRSPPAAALARRRRPAAAAVGAIFAGTKATTSALRGHDDAFSSAVAGCAAGSMAGVKRTSARTPIAAPLLSRARWPLAAGRSPPLAAHRRRRRAPPTQTALDIVPSAAAFSAASWQARRAWPPTAPTTTQR